MLKQAGGIIGFIHGTGLKLPKVAPEPSGFIGTLVKTFKDAYRLAKHPKKTSWVQCSYH